MVEEYYELQFQENYFEQLNQLIAPNFVFNAKGSITSLKLPLELTEHERNIALSILWKIQFNRKFIMTSYEEVLVKMKALEEGIERELN